MTKKVAILQSNYIPWKGYFDLIHMVDEFILYDDMQYTRRDWRNRNKIKTPNGLLWLTIPVEVKGRYYQRIRETKVSENNWKQNHWKTICYNYSKASFFEDYKDLLEELYWGCEKIFLSEINYEFIMAINKILGIKTKISWSSDYNIIDGKTERLVDLCIQANATEYISGPAAKDYIDERLFKENNIRLTWIDYSGYPEYHQLYPPFEHTVSIIDLIFNEGPNATKFMKSFKI
jgi:hypothetical protein